MKFNKIRFYLHNYENIDKEISLIKIRIHELSNYDNIQTTIQFKEIISYTNQINSSVENNAINRIETIEKLNNKISELKNIKLAIDTTKLYLNQTDKKIIQLRFDNNIGESNSYKYISKKLNFSIRYIKQKEFLIIKKILDNLNYIKS